MVPKYFFIAVLIVIGSILVASGLCPKNSSNSNGSCSRQVGSTNGPYYCKYLYLEFF